MKLDNHIKVYRAHRALAVVATLLGPLLVLASSEPGEQAHQLSGVLLCLFAVFHWMTSSGAKRGAKWAKIATRVYGVLALPAIPVGTIIGVYLLLNSKEWHCAETE